MRNQERPAGRSNEVYCLTRDDIRSIVMTARREAWLACLQELKFLVDPSGMPGSLTRSCYQAMIVVNSLETSGRFDEIFSQHTNHSPGYDYDDS